MKPKIYVFGPVLDRVLSREFLLYSSSSVFVAWRLDQFQLDGSSLGIGPGWLQNIFEVVAVAVACFVGLAFIAILCCLPLLALFPDLLHRRIESSGTTMERLVQYGFVMSCFWVLFLG